MPAYGHSRNITRVAVNPRLGFGIPLDKLCSEGRLHSGLRDLFLKAHLCADTEASFRRKKNQPAGNLDAAHIVLKLLGPGENGLGTLAERLSLKTRLEVGEWIVATPTSPGAPLWLLEHFLGCLPSPIFGEEYWEQLSEECKECVEKAIAGSPNTCSLIQKLSKYLKRLSVGEFLTVAALLGLMRNLATDGRTTDLNKTAVMALVRYFIPSLVSRPYRPGFTSPDDHQKYPLLLFLCYYWPEIREECDKLSQESPRTSRCSSLSTIQQKVKEPEQKKCRSLPNANGIDKERAESQNFKQRFARCSLPTGIPERCIYLCRSKPNGNDIKHQPQCIWRPIFLEKEVDDPTLFDNKNNAFKPASLFICTYCGKCCEKVDQETQCDDSSPLYCSESSEKHEKSTQIELEYAPKSFSVHGSCGSEKHTLNSTHLHAPHASTFSSNSTFCSCYSSRGDTNDSNKGKKKLHKNSFSQRASAPYLFKDFLTSSTEPPFYTKEASSMSCLNDVIPLLAEKINISAKAEETAEFCSTMKCNGNDSTNMDYLCNGISRGKHNMPISERSMKPEIQDGLRGVNKSRHIAPVFGKDRINPKFTAEPYKSIPHYQAGREASFTGRFLKPLGEEDRCHTEFPMLDNYWEKDKELAVKQKHFVEKSNTYPFQTSCINKNVFAVAGADADADDEHPRRSSEPSALPRSRRLRFKPKKWLREAMGFGGIKTFSRTSSSHKPDTSP